MRPSQQSGAPRTDSAGPSPVGSGDYVVRSGDCMESIAAANGWNWKTLWDHPDNAELKQKRGDPNVLLPGDRVTIPQKRAGEQSGADGKRHRFRRRGIPGRLRLALRKGDEPRKNEAFTLDVDGRIIQGSTDGDGAVDVPIPPHARQARLTIGQDVYRFELGGMDPADTITGAQGRLKNLGLYGGPADGRMSAETGAALAAFQRQNGLQTSGELDQATTDKLKQVYGS